MSPLKKYGFMWVTLAIFMGSCVGHWMFAWGSYVEEQRAHSQPVEFKNYAVETARDTLENWQSEFLQLLWQVAGLAFLLHVGSPQSKDGDERKEEKIDEILKLLDETKGKKIIRELETKFPKS